MTRILIIDDDDLVRATLSRILKLADYEVIEATDGAEGLEIYHGGNVDLIIIDLLMPIKEGMETIRELRQGGSVVKIIAVSGGGRTGNKLYLTMAEKMGADGILPKPILPRELLSKVDAVMRL